MHQHLAAVGPAGQASSQPAPSVDEPPPRATTVPSAGSTVPPTTQSVETQTSSRDEEPSDEQPSEPSVVEVAAALEEAPTAPSEASPVLYWTTAPAPSLKRKAAPKPPSAPKAKAAAAA